MTAPEVIQRIWMPPLWEVGDGIIPVDAQSEDDDVSYILATPEALAASPEVQALIADAVTKLTAENAALTKQVAMQRVINKQAYETGLHNGTVSIRNAVEDLLAWDTRRKYLLPYRIRDQMLAAIRDCHKPGE